MFNYRMWMTQEQVKQAQEIGQHLRVTIRRSGKQKHFRVIVTPDGHPQGEALASSMVMDLTRELQNGLYSIWGIQGELVDVD